MDGEPPLRIAQVNEVARVGSYLVAGMRELGQDAQLVEPWQPGAGIAYPWKLATVPLRAAGFVGTAAALRRGRFDVVHVHYAALGIIGPLAGQPYALHVHGSDIRGIAPASVRGRALAPFIRRARLVYYATPDLREWVEPFRRDAIFLPNPIETAAFEPAAGAGGDRPEPAADVLVGVRLDPIKGADTVVETIRAIRRLRPETSFTIVRQGAGVAAAVEAAGEHAVLLDPTDRPGLARLMRRHRVALGQFRVGSMGMYELECLAAGLPVAMRFTYDAAYDVAPPLLNAAAAVEAAAAVSAVLDDPIAREHLAAASTAWVRAHHDSPSVARRVLADYRLHGVVKKTEP